MQPTTSTPLNTLSSIAFKAKGGIANYPDHEYQIKLIAEQGIAEASVAPRGQQGGQRIDCNWQATPDCTLANLIRIMLQQHPQMLAKIEEKEGKTGELKVEAVDVYRILEKEKRKQVQKLLKQLKKAYPTHIEIEITTTLQGKNYLLRLCPSNLKQSKAFLIQQGKEGPQIGLDLGFLERLSLEDLRALFAKDVHAFIRFDIEQRQSEEYLCLSPSEASFLPIGSLKNTKDLVKYLNWATPQALIVKEILKKMVDAFTEMSQPRVEVIEEIIEIFDYLEPNDQTRVLRSTANHFARNEFNDQNIFKILTKIFTHFQQALYSQPANPIDSKDLLFTHLNEVDIKNLVNFLIQLTASLKPESLTQNLIFVQSRLKLLIALLETIMARQVKGIDQDVYVKAYDAIKALAHNKEVEEDLETYFLAMYGKHAFLQVPNDFDSIDATKSIGTRAFYLMRGLAKIAGGLSLFEPGLIADAAFESLKYFKKTFLNLKMESTQLSKWLAKKRWFTSLLALRFSLLNQRVQLFDALNDLYHAKEGSKILKQDIFHSPLFLTGFAHILEEVLDIPTRAPLDLALKKLAIQLLQRIYETNQENQELDSSTPFRLELQKNRDQLREMIKRALLESSTHANTAEISYEVGLVLQALGLVSHSTSQVSVKTSELFKKAAEQLPFFNAIQSVAVQLKRDDQLTKEKVYYISPNVQEEDQLYTSFPFEQALSEFFESKQVAVLHLEGDGGAGKTLTMKMLAQKLLEKYSEGSYFPVYVYLGSLSKPFKKIVEEAFQLYRMSSEQIRELTERKIVFICDAFDEINPTKLNDAKNVGINVYEANQFARQRIDKVIFVSKSGFAKACRFQPIGTQKLSRKLILSPFSEEQIFSYVQQFAHEKQKKLQKQQEEIQEQLEQEKEQGKQEELQERLEKIGNVLSIWTPEIYQETFEKLKGSVLWELISNPFRLHVIAEVLPIFMQQYPNKKVEDILSQQTKGEIEQKFFAIFACVQAYRSSLKDRPQYIPPRKFLIYSAQLAAAMENKGIYSIPLKSQEEEEWLASLEDELASLSIDSNASPHAKGKEKDSIGSPASQPKIASIKAPEISPAVKEVMEKYFKDDLKIYYKECLILRNKEWSFIHRDYQLHLSQYSDYPERSRILDEILNTYQFEQWITPDENPVEETK